MFAKQVKWLALASVALGLSSSSCQTDAYCFVCEKGPSGGTGGGPPISATGGGPSFLGTGGAAKVDDSGAGGSAAPCKADLQTDANNCGACGNICSTPGAFSKCVGGVCQFDTCAPGLVDLNKDPKDGCECTTTAGGVELCDDLDNNCDGRTDETFNLATDVQNCGACNTECPALPQATVACAAKQCVYTCDSGFSNLGQAGLGCPYKCPVFPTTAETCDGVDQDCDGIIDNGDPGAGVPCDDQCPVDSTGKHKCVGACTSGRTVCTSTTAGVACVGGTQPTGEVCDGIDNDCNGTTDEGFDTQTDVLNCGSCNTQCQTGIACAAGKCQFICATNQRDLDKNPANGCEYTCPVFPVQTEICDGIDQDCDGIADNGSTDVGVACADNCPAPDACVAAGNCTSPSPKTGNCYGVCGTGGLTACPAGLKVCQYSNYRIDELCNGKDDNCDGRVDEGFDFQQDPLNCGVCGNICKKPNALSVTCAGGACTTVTACLPGFQDNNGNPADGCEYRCPVFPPTGEACDGVDNNCDGLTDNTPSGSGQSCTANCPAPAACIAANNCTLTKSAETNGCYGACAADGRTDCQAGSSVCTHPGKSAETCNGLDDDCDGLIDNGFDLLTDVSNCGSCGYACALPGASTQTCVAGACQSTACTAGFKDLNGNGADGCEYKCPIFPIVGETCNGKDDDCNGLTDDSPSDAGKPCTGSCPAPDACVTAGNCAPFVIAPQTAGCYGACSAGGVGVCTAGALACRYDTKQKNEICNNVDDNCDGVIDEGFDKTTDPGNCGGCGTICAATNATARACTAGVCGAITVCAAGYRDNNGNPADGCEYKCPVFPPVSEVCNGKDDDCNGGTDDNVVGIGQACTNNCPAPDACVAASSCTVAVSSNTNGCFGVCATDGRTTCPSGGVVVCAHNSAGTEACNGLDDNCDGRIDEGFNKQTDVNNCGACGNKCSLPGAATVQCVTGACQVVTCNAGFANLDGNPGNGCEYACPVFPTKAELCNGLDDDCNGVIDNAPTDVNLPCPDNCPGGTSCVGICTPGATVCISGKKICQGGGGAKIEICNVGLSLDDNCNGVTDEGFNKLTDPLNCGTCGTKCALANVGVNGCTGGLCSITSCAPGFSDKDKIASNGCEYTCPVFPLQAETCNGKDDDCDGLTDAADSTPPGAMVVPVGNTCLPTGAPAGTLCAGVTPVCTVLSATVSDWRCNYPAGVDVAANGAVAFAEARCDGVDNNCNGQTDESFANKDQPCTVGKGVCAGNATSTCKPDKTGTECLATATPTNAVDEDCNNKDDDCDGVTDERAPVGGSLCYNPSKTVADQHACVGWVDPMVKLGAANVWTYAYEASRTDSTAALAGGAGGRACSKGNKQPWTSVRYAEAAAACAAVKDSNGTAMRLCTETEWQNACEAGTAGAQRWSYAVTASAATYVSGQCNDNGAGVGGPWATGKTGAGADNTCYANWTGSKIFDLSGNVSEWTSTSAVSSGVTYQRVRGGNYQTFPNGTTCEFAFVLETTGAAGPPPTGFQNFDLGFRCCADHAP
jgi:hypothetical protein